MIQRFSHFFAPAVNFCLSRRYSNTQNNLWVLGNSNITTPVVLEGMRRGYKPLVTTHNPILPKMEGVQFVHTPSNCLKNKDFWRDLVRKHTSEGDSLLLLNTIGGSIANSDQTMEDLNCHIPLAAISGIKEGVNNRLTNYQVVHLSTMAAAGLKAPYGRTKREAEERLLDLGHNRLTIFRMAYVVEPLFRSTVTQTYKAQHQLSLEQMSLLPIHFLIGDRPQYNKIKVPLVSIEDVVTGVFRTTFQRTPNLIDVVNRDNITQEQFFNFFTTLLGKPFRPFHIPLDAARRLEKHHTFGHLVSYAIEYCANEQEIELDYSEFEKLILRRPKSLNEIYGLDQELVIPRPPLAEFSFHLLKNLWKKPQSRMDTLRAIQSIAKAFVENDFVMKLDWTSTAEKKNYTSMSVHHFNQLAERNRINQLFKMSEHYFNQLTESNRINHLFNQGI